MNEAGRRTGWIAGLVAAAAGASVAVYASTRDDRVAGSDRTAIEAVVRAYILEHPEIIPEALDRLAIVSNRSRIETPFAGAWAGNPKGDVTVVEFFDYACGYCRAMLPDIERLIAEDANVRLVFREWPVLSDPSVDAARASLAAAKQGRFLEFHRAMYAAGRVDGPRIAAARKAGGLAAARATADAAGSDVATELQTNAELARSLHFTGTPSFVVGDRIINGLVDYAALKAAVAAARGRKS